jgi:hypothetical protein
MHRRGWTKSGQFSTLSSTNSEFIFRFCKSLIYQLAQHLRLCFFCSDTLYKRTVGNRHTQIVSFALFICSVWFCCDAALLGGKCTENCSRPILLCHQSAFFGQCSPPSSSLLTPLLMVSLIPLRP